MANTRIKDISTAATTLNSDDFIAVDGSTAGTRKMAKADLISEVSSGVSGTYLEESNNLSDVASLDTSKLNMEIPDVGTAPNEVPMNGMLGDMAYQSSEGISVGTLEVTDKIDLSGAPTQQLEVYGDAPTVRLTDTSFLVGDGDSIGKLEFYGNDGSAGGPNVRAKIDTVSENSYGNTYGLAISTSTANSAPVERLRVDGQGRVGIGGSPSYDLHVTNASTAASIGITGSGGSKDTWTVTSSDTGGKAVLNLTNADTGTTVLQLHQDNKLVLSSGGGIDFGSASGGTGTVATNGGLLNDYEFGTFTVTTAGDATGAMSSFGEYTKIGRLVNVRIVFQVSTNFTANQIGGLPFTVDSLGTGPSAVSSPSLVLNSSNTDSPVTCNTVRGNTTVAFSAGTNVGVAHNPNTANFTYRLQFSYHTDD